MVDSKVEKKEPDRNENVYPEGKYNFSPFETGPLTADELHHIAPMIGSADFFDWGSALVEIQQATNVLADSIPGGHTEHTMDALDRLMTNGGLLQAFMLVRHPNSAYQTKKRIEAERAAAGESAIAELNQDSESDDDVVEDVEVNEEDRMKEVDGPEQDA
jgi:hypothetical protein